MENNTREYNIYDMTERTLFVYDIRNDTLEIIEDFNMDGTHMICAVFTEDDVVDVSGDPDHETWITRAVSKLVDIVKIEMTEEAFEYVIEHIMNLEDEEDDIIGGLDFGSDENDTCGVNIAELLLDVEDEEEKNEEDVLADIAELLLDVEDEEYKPNNQLHPEHYNRGLEVIDFTNLYNLNGNEFNIVKYLLRYPFKGTPIEDLNKALNYTNFEIRRITNHESIMIESNRMLRVKDITDEQYYFTHDFLMSWKPYFKESEWGFVSNIINNIETIHSEELTIYDRVDVLYNIQNDIEDLIEVVKNND